MQNVMKWHSILFVFIFIHLKSCIFFSYKLDNVIIKNPQFSETLGKTLKKINKGLTGNNKKYDTCSYQKVPNILVETKQKKKNGKTNYIVGIENTCDDTCVCVIDTNLNIIINVIISHFRIVDKYSGVYPFFISSINEVFLKKYVDAILKNIDTKNIICYGMSVCPGITKSMKAAKNYIEEKRDKHIKVSVVNHIFAHILSPLFFPFYNDDNTYTNNSEYKKNSTRLKNISTINLNVSDAIKGDILFKKRIQDILKILNKNEVTKKVMNDLTETEFFNLASYKLRKTNEHQKERTTSIDRNKECLKEYKVGFLKDGYICVLVSGGSTEVYKIQNNGKKDILIQKIAETVDISIGDIIDKIARSLDLPVGIGGGYFLEKKSEEFLQRLKECNMNVEEYEDPFQPFPLVFSHSNIINFSFSGIFTHMSKIIEKLKYEKNFEQKKDQYAYFCQKNIFLHLVKQLNKIMYFSELHFNIKNMCIVGGVGCNYFLYKTLKQIAKKRNTIEYQIKEFNQLKKRLKKKIKNIDKILLKKTNTIEDTEHLLKNSLSWKHYFTYLLEKKRKEEIFSAFNVFNFEMFTKIKNEGHFLFNGSTTLNSSREWKIYKTPSNLSKDNAAMICFNTFLNLCNKKNVYEDLAKIKIKQTVQTKLENQFLFLSDIIVFDAVMHNWEMKA